MVMRLRIALSAEEWELLRRLSEADLRPLVDEIRFLIRAEAERRLRPVSASKPESAEREAVPWQR